MSSELREITAQNKLAEWAGKITACRSSGQPVLAPGENRHYEPGGNRQS